MRASSVRDTGSVRTDCQSNSRRLNGNALANRFIERAAIARDAVKSISVRNRELAGYDLIDSFMDPSSSSHDLDACLLPSSLLLVFY